MMCSEQPRKLAELLAELEALAVTVRAYATLHLAVEEAQATSDYQGLLLEICQRLNLDPANVFHPLLGAPERAPFGVSVLV